MTDYSAEDFIEITGDMTKKAISPTVIVLAPRHLIGWVSNDLEVALIKKKFGVSCVKFHDQPPSKLAFKNKLAYVIIYAGTFAPTNFLGFAQARLSDERTAFITENPHLLGKNSTGKLRVIKAPLSIFAIHQALAAIMP